MDDSDLTVAEVVNVVMSAMTTSLKGFSEQKKKAETTQPELPM
jgi:hypothetical protein